MHHVQEPGLLLYLALFFIGYGCGSFPTAYLLVRGKHRADIRRQGSGNVGGLNTFEVTGSAGLAGAVIALDIAKGLLAVVIASRVAGTDYLPLAVAGLGAVVGHIFPVWLRFHGGRGLATAAGVMAALGWSLILVWVVAWGVTYAVSRRLHLANIIATLCLPALPLLLPSTFATLLPAQVAEPQFAAVAVGLSIILLLGHRGPVVELLRSHHNA